MCLQLWSSLPGQRLSLRSNGSPASVQQPNPYTTSPKTPLPPMAGKGTGGHGETAEKTRHTRVRPLNTGVTVKWPENHLSLRMIYLLGWARGAPVHTRHREGMRTVLPEPTLKQERKPFAKLIHTHTRAEPLTHPLRVCCMLVV